MNETVAGLAGALIVGAFTLGGVYIQNRYHASESARRLEHERCMARDQFEREQVTSENEWLSARIGEQLAWGDRITRAVGRADYLLESVSDKEQRLKILGQVWAFARLDPDATSPLADLLEPELLEDDELRRLVAAHKETLHEGYMGLAFGDYRPEKLPSADDFAERVATLKKQVALRTRTLRREGRPL